MILVLANLLDLLVFMEFLSALKEPSAGKSPNSAIFAL